MAQDGYQTLADGYEAVFEFEDRRSRFIAQLVHAKGQKECEKFIEEVRARHHDARHNVPAWVLSDGRERCSDDGEPSRTAGMPTLDVLRGAGLADVCCVVTRYFGGVKLGPGGLVRAYTAATQGAVQRAADDGKVVAMTQVTRVTCVVPYAAYGRVRRMATDAGAHPRDAIFSEDVQLTCDFLSGHEKPFLDAMEELFAGQQVCTVGEPRFAQF
ncbi:MAG: YigZ family protein [Coriobacteriales bacterium]|nr:YigZ family protein [Coriobacteriales bacterium]